MQFPNNEATELTEDIMLRCVSDIMQLEAREYNKLFELIYSVIYERLNSANRPKVLVIGGFKGRMSSTQFAEIIVGLREQSKDIILKKQLHEENLIKLQTPVNLEYPEILKEMSPIYIPKRKKFKRK